MNNDLVSIITPVYNAEKYVSKAIESVKFQTYSNWELLIVNDGSTDKSLEKIYNEIKGIEKKCKLINLAKNKGVSNARNVALNIANGQYIAYLDADDIWERQKLEKQLLFMKNKKCYFSYTSYARMTEDEKFLRIVEAPQETSYKDLLKSTIMLTSTIMIDISKIEKEQLKMPNLERSEDTQTWLNILKKGIIAYGLNENLARYRKCKKSASSSKIKSTIGIWKVYRNYQLMGRIKSSYYTSLHVLNAIKKRIVWINKMRTNVFYKISQKPLTQPKKNDKI